MGGHATGLARVKEKKGRINKSESGSGREIWSNERHPIGGEAKVFWSDRKRRRVGQGLHLLAQQKIGNSFLAGAGLQDTKEKRGKKEKKIGLSYPRGMSFRGTNFPNMGR